MDEMKLNIGSHSLPINAATKTFAILAKRGAGKTYTAAVMAEEFFKNNIPIVVFDPIDVWFGLRFKNDGKSKGLPIVVFGIEHADIKIDKNMGRQIAQAIVKNNISCVISTFGMSKTDQKHLITEFAEEILTINNTPRHIFIEEAHEFVPQRIYPGTGRMFNAVSNLVVMGRNRGLGVTLINQRAATINKDVLTQVDAILSFRSVSPQDKKALGEYSMAHGGDDRETFNEFIKSLPSLPTGEGWIWSPEFLGLFERIKIRKRETFHPDREKMGEMFIVPELEQIDLKDFISSFNKNVETTQPKTKEKIKIEKEEEKQESIDLIALRNDYESKILQKDLEIRKRDEIISHIRKLVGASESSPIQAPSSNMEMWINKLGNSMPSKVLRFLYERRGLKFTKSQIALACKYSVKGGSFATAISTLKRNNLIVVDGNKNISVNPDL